jgi:hypothetical protein
MHCLRLYVLADPGVMRALGTRCERPHSSNIVEAPHSLADDPTGDQIDALLCAVQASWAWTQRSNGFGAPVECDDLEGWIADPLCQQSKKAN